MAFASFDDYLTPRNTGRSLGFVFYSLGLASKIRRASYPSFKGKITKTINGKEREVPVHAGHSSTGYLLADERVASSAIIQIHPAVSEDNEFALCRKSVDPNVRCPICDGYKAAKDAVKGSDMKPTYKYKAAIDKIYLPFIALDFVDSHEILYDKTTGEPQKDVLPIYWFSVEVTPYKDAKFANLQRLISHIRKPGSNDFATKIIAPIPADKQTQEYHYELTNLQPELPDDVWKHPLFDQGYIIEGKKGFEFTPEYRELVRNLALLQPQRAVNPATGEVLTYLDENGVDIIERAEAHVKEALDGLNWNPYTKLDGDEAPF